MTKPTLFDAVGGRPTLERAHKLFYDQVYAHPWLGQFFAGHSQQAIENRQTEFMAEKMGGPEHYRGKDIEMVHEAMYVTPELFEIRRELLEMALIEVGLDPGLRNRWLRIDGAFMQKVVKNDYAEFQKRSWPYKKHIVIPKPE